jgi:hypothetical protein
VLQLPLSLKSIAQIDSLARSLKAATGQRAIPANMVANASFWLCSITFGGRRFAG